MARLNLKKTKLRIGDIVGYKESEKDDDFFQLEIVSGYVENHFNSRSVFFKNLTFPEHEDSYGLTEIQIHKNGLIQTYLNAGKYFLIARGTNEKSKIESGRYYIHG